MHQPTPALEQWGRVLPVCPMLVFSYNSKMLLHGTFRKKKKRLLSIMEAICLHVHPVTKPQPPHAHTDFPGPGRNNQHMRGKGRTPRLPLDQHQYTHSCYFGNIWVYLTEHFMHSSSTCIATNKGFSNAGMYKYSFSHRDIVIQFKCLELQLLK